MLLARKIVEPLYRIGQRVLYSDPFTRQQHVGTVTAAPESACVLPTYRIRLDIRWKDVCNPITGKLACGIPDSFAYQYIVVGNVMEGKQIKVCNDVGLLPT